MSIQTSFICYRITDLNVPGNVVSVSDSDASISRQLVLLTLPVMVAETVSLGILSLPAVVATLGLVPYVLDQQLLEVISSSN